MISVTKGTIGYQINIDCVSNVSTATVKKIHYKKPSGAAGSWDATIGTSELIVYQWENGVRKKYTLEANTYIYFVTVGTSDLDEVGQWKIQSYIEMVGYSGYGTDSGSQAWAILNVDDTL